MPHLPFADLLDFASLTIATVSHTGEPHAATLYFSSNHALNFYFVSSPTSAHIQNLQHNPCAAVTINPPATNWHEIRGLQMRGLVVEIEATTLIEQAAANYLDKFPFVKSMQNEVTRNSWYQFTPTWLRWIDNRVHFGYKKEWSGDALLYFREE